MKTPHLKFVAPFLLPCAVSVLAFLTGASPGRAADPQKPVATETRADTLATGAPTAISTQIYLGFGATGLDVDNGPSAFYSNVVPGTHVTLGVNLDASKIASIIWTRDDARLSVTTPTIDFPSASVSDSGRYTAYIQTNPDGHHSVFTTFLRVERASGRRLINLSTRATLSPSQPFFISGFVVSSSTYSQDDKGVLVRAVGPALKAYGITDGLPDPVLEVFDADGNRMVPIISSRGLGLDLITAQVGAFPLPNDSLDIAATFALPKGIYSARVSSASHASGTVLLEVYDTQP